MLCCAEGWDFLVELVMVVEGLELQAVRGLKGCGDGAARSLARSAAMTHDAAQGD